MVPSDQIASFVFHTEDPDLSRILRWHHLVPLCVSISLSVLQKPCGFESWLIPSSPLKDCLYPLNLLAPSSDRGILKALLDYK